PTRRTSDLVDDDIGETLKGGANDNGSERAGRELRGQKLENEALRQAQEIRLRVLAFPRTVLGNRAEEHADGVAAGLFHGAVDGTSGFLGSQAAGGLERG